MHWRKKIDDHRFAGCTFCWNLVSRSNRVGNLAFEPITWQGDALIVHLPKTKGDQEGEKAFPRHVFSNPLNPKVCPIVALAVHVFSSELCPSKTKMKVFQSTKPQGLFNSWLSGLWGRISFSYFLFLFFLRKGGATYALSFPGGPSAVAVSLLASCVVARANSVPLCVCGRWRWSICGKGPCRLANKQYRLRNFTTSLWIWICGVLWWTVPVLGELLEVSELFPSVFAVSGCVTVLTSPLAGWKFSVYSSF